MSHLLPPWPFSLSSPFNNRDSFSPFSFYTPQVGKGCVGWLGVVRVSGVRESEREKAEEERDGCGEL